MKIITALSLKYLVKNKRRNVVTILGISIVTILVTTILILFSSYIEYMVNLTRAKNNWEAKFSNITYSDALEIAKNKNIREISISRKIGISEENFSILNNDVLKFDIRAYDDSKLKNSNIYVTEGRLPNKQNEIIISMLYKDEGRFEKKIELGNTLSLTCDGQTEEYIVVRKN